MPRRLTYITADNARHQGVVEQASIAAEEMVDTPCTGRRAPTNTATLTEADDLHRHYSVDIGPETSPDDVRRPLDTKGIGERPLAEWIYNERGRDTPNTMGTVRMCPLVERTIDCRRDGGRNGNTDNDAG